MDYGWIVSGAGSIWVAKGGVLTRRFTDAMVTQEPFELLKLLRQHYPGVKFRLWHLKAKLVEEE